MMTGNDLMPDNRCKEPRNTFDELQTLSSKWRGEFLEQYRPYSTQGDAVIIRKKR